MEKRNMTQIVKKSVRMLEMLPESEQEFAGHATDS